MIVHSTVDSEVIQSEIGRQVSSTIEQDTVYSEELEYTEIIIRITEENEIRRTQENDYRII